MIQIIKEENSSIENMTDAQIQELYDKQKSRIEDLVQLKIDIILEKLPKYKEAIVKEVIRDAIPNYYFDKDDLVIVSDSDDFEDRMEEIKDIMRLQDSTDDIINNDIDDIIEKIITGE